MSLVQNGSRFIQKDASREDTKTKPSEAHQEFEPGWKSGVVTLARDKKNSTAYKKRFAHVDIPLNPEHVPLSTRVPVKTR